MNPVNPLRDEFYGDTGSPRTANERKLYRAEQFGDDAAVFVRLLELPRDGADAVRTIDRLLDQVEWPILNELKHTSIPR